MNNIQKSLLVFTEGSKSTNNNLRMVLGGGNIDNDFQKYNGHYDISITNNRYLIDPTNISLISLNIDINSNDELNNLASILPQRFCKIVLDVSTNKFLDWTEETINILGKMLKKNGELYIDTTIYACIYLTDHLNLHGLYTSREIGNKKIIINFSNNNKIHFVLPKLLIDNSDIKLPNHNDMINRTLIIIKRNNFIAKILEEGYPIKDDNQSYIKAIKTF